MNQVEKLEAQLAKARAAQANRIKPPSVIEFGDSGVILLQRQGWSNRLRSSKLSTFPAYVEISDYLGKHFSLEVTAPEDAYRNSLRFIRRELASVQEAVQLIRHTFGEAYVAAPFVHGYCYPFGDDVAAHGKSDSYAGTTEDKYVLEYALNGDMVVDALHLEPCLGFTEGLNWTLTEFAPPRLKGVLGGSGGPPPNGWFHQCDLDKGEAYCRERFVWLLNSYALDGYRARPRHERAPLAVAGSINVDRWPK